MRRYLTKLNVAAGSVLVGVFGIAGSAFAAPGDPPEFDAGTLEAPFNDYATALLAGVVILLGIVVVIAAPFTLVKMGIKALKSWVGRSKATSAVS